MHGALEQFKTGRRQAWASFTPFEMVTTTTAPRLVSFADVRAGQHRTLELLQRARENAAIADIDMDWHEGDAERLPSMMVPSIRC